MITYLKEHSFIILRLIIPLAFIALIFLYLSQFFCREIFINLFTDFVSIIVTLLYINWIIQLQEKKKWKIIHERIRNNCGKIGQKIVSEIIRELGLEDKINPKIDLDNFSIQEFQQEINNRVKNLRKKEIAISLAKFDHEKWLRIIDKIRELKQQVENILIRYSDRLNPEDIDLLSKLEERSAVILNNYSLYEFFLQIPLIQVSELENKEYGIYNNIAIKTLSIDIRHALDSALEVVKTFDYGINVRTTDYIKEIENFD